MGYQEELTRLQEAKASMRQSIINKGVEVPEEAKIEDYPDYIAQIQSAPKLTDWGKLYTTEYPDGKELTETDWNNLATVGDESKVISLSFGNIVKSSITRFEFGSQPTSIGDYFGYYWVNLASISDIPDNITSIGKYFMNFCSSFNQPLVISENIVSIDYGFLQGCSIFNSKVSIPDTPIKIGTSFMQSCTLFEQPLAVPESVSSIGGSFLYNCGKFVGPLTVECPATVISAYQALSTPSHADPMYATGVTLLGSQASAWKSKLPNSGSSPYRKLVLG